MNDRQTIAGGVGRLGQLGLDPIAVADQDDRQLGMIGNSFACSRDNRTGSEIAPHRVQGYAHGSSRNI